MVMTLGQDYIAKISSRGTITIPRGIRKQYNLRRGQDIAFIEDEGKLVIIPIVNLAELRKDFIF
jgi:AbrB family looped-hinge helix DNA binding protein